MTGKSGWQRVAGWVHEGLGLLFFLVYCLGRIPPLGWDRNPSWDFFGLLGVFLTLLGALMLESAQIHERVSALEKDIEALRKGESKTGSGEDSA